MTVEDITELTERITELTVGGLDLESIIATSKGITEIGESGKVPVLVVFPDDVFATLFDDGEFSANVEKFSEIRARHTKAALEEYAAWKVLQTRAKTGRKGRCLPAPRRSSGRICARTS